MFGAGKSTLSGHALHDLGWTSRKPGAVPDRDSLRKLRRADLDGPENLGTRTDGTGVVTERAPLNFRVVGHARAVRTASAAQLREKMYTGSSEAWRRYGDHLAPLPEELAAAG